MSSFDNVISNDPAEKELGLTEDQLTESALIKQRSVSGAIAYVFRTFAIQIVGIVASIALSVLFSAEEFGIYYAVTALIGFFTFFSDVGLAAALVQKAETPTVKELRTIFTVQLMLALGIFLTVVALTPIWRNLLHLEQTGIWLLYAMAGSFVLSSLRTIPSILLERELLFNKVIIPTLVENISFYVILVFLAWRGFSLMSYTYAVLVRSLLGVATVYLIKRWPIGLAFDIPSLKKLMSFGVKFQVNDLLARIKDDLLVVFLGWWLGAQGLGYVGWAKRWSTFPYQLTVQSVLGITFPAFSRIQDQKDLLRKAIEKSLYFITFMAFPMVTGLAAYIYPLLVVLPQFNKWLPAALSLSLFAIQIGMSAISTPLTNTLMAIGEVNKNLKLMVMWTVLTWTVTPISVWLFGFQGVAIAALIIGLTSVVPAFYVKQAIPQVTFLPHIWLQALAAAAILLIGFLGQAFWQRSIWWLIGGIGLAAAAYLIIFFGLGWRRFLIEVKSLGVLKKWLH